jgi:hypothetical protein
MRSLTRIHQHHRGRSLNEELIYGVNGRGGVVGVGVVGSTGLLLFGTKHGGASRKK